MRVMLGKINPAGESRGPFVALGKEALNEHFNLETVEEKLLITLEMDNRRYIEV
jgi:hypothetical protein